MFYQAQARCHRIGQTAMVKVYRLITRGTYERLMFERASRKLGLDRAVLGKLQGSVVSGFFISSSREHKLIQPPLFSGEDDEGGEEGRLDKHTVDLLLRYGAYDMLNDTPNSESRYDEDDIDTILERAVTIKHNEEGRGGGGGLEAFAKASFCSADAAPEIELDDPDFWKKVTQTRGSSLHSNNNNNYLHKGIASRVLEKKGTCGSGTSLAPQKTRL